MSQLEKLKAATTLHDVAHILGFKPKSLAYLLYKKPSAERYKEFEIPKRTGGKRSISAPYPDLMNLQKRLSDLLQDCISEINVARKIESALSHGFRRKYSIITNATIHRNKRYVFNIDLENFFGTINFGRVRGFFIANRNFELNPAVATVLAQIACHENALPQGSPCSPVISNLIGHLLDIRLAALSNQVSCSYSRYADDLTFSTNKRNFPTEVAKLTGEETHQWQVGKKLERIVEKAGFTINNAKTRMQYMNSRQDVTGLVVNSKVNTRAEYRRTARAMVHRLLNTGSFQRKQISPDDNGDLVETEVNGTLEQLNGMLSFIDSISVFNKRKDMKPSDRKKALKWPKHPDCNEKVYRHFLFFKNFHASPNPLIICEGKTDNIYLKAAIQRLADAHPCLAEKKENGSIGLKVSFFRRNATTGRILGLAGGTGELTNIIKMYTTESKHIAAPGKKQPVILIIDNDDGAKGIYSYVKNLTKSPVDPKSPFIFVTENLYIVPTPLTHDGKSTMIEDFFEAGLKETKLNGKTFNPSDKGFNSKTEYGKNFFAKHVVKKKQATIDFSGFKPILERIEAVLNDHSKKPS